MDRSWLEDLLLDRLRLQCAVLDPLLVATCMRIASSCASCCLHRLLAKQLAPCRVLGVLLLLLHYKYRLAMVDLGKSEWLVSNYHTSTPAG